jgi:hypothetical protein
VHFFNVGCGLSSDQFAHRRKRLNAVYQDLVVIIKTF